MLVLFLLTAFLGLRGGTHHANGTLRDGNSGYNLLAESTPVPPPNFGHARPTPASLDGCMLWTVAVYMEPTGPTFAAEPETCTALFL